MAYLGLVPSEYSPGETQRRGALTKAGNSHARRVLVEAAWHYRHRPTIGRALANRSQGQPDEIVSHAWRAQQRLHRRYRHLLGHGKRTPVAVAAVARELVGFIWAAMTRHERAGAKPRNHRDRSEKRSRVVTPRFPSGVGHGAMRARLESPRVCYATPGVRIGTTRASRQRQLPTKRCHAARLFGATRAYQPDSSSQPLHRQPRASVLGNCSAFTPARREPQHRLRDPARHSKPLDSWSFHI